MPRVKGSRLAMLPPTPAIRAEMKALQETQRMLAGVTDATADVPDALGAAPQGLPTATEIAMAELTLPQKHEYLLVLRTMAQRMLTAMFPRVVYKFAQKVENHREPGDSKLILEYLKGMGGFEPSAPMTENERKRKMSENAEFEQLTLEDLKARAQESLR